MWLNFQRAAGNFWVRSHVNVDGARNQVQATPGRKKKTPVPLAGLSYWAHSVFLATPKSNEMSQTQEALRQASCRTHRGGDPECRRFMSRTWRVTSSLGSCWVWPCLGDPNMALVSLLIYLIKPHKKGVLPEKITQLLANIDMGFPSSWRGSFCFYPLFNGV